MLIMAERVNHPPHYNAGGIECIDALEAATSGLQGIEAFCTANAIKYLWRWKLKNGEEDLQKAVWYINRLIQRAGADSAAGKELFNMKENKHGFEPKQEFTMGGIAWTVIQTGADWVKCIASDCVEERAFDEGNKNDFAASSLRAYLNGEFLRRLIKAGAPEEMFEYFNIDLTADDGLKNYGGDRVRIGLITCEEYRLLRGNIPALPDRWWWTATPDSPINSFVRFVGSDGSLHYNSACNGFSGVRPLCNLKSSILVSDSPNSDGNYTVIYNSAPSAPPSITAPATCYSGQNINISCAAATDPDGDALTYCFERSYNSGAWTQVQASASRTFTEAVSTAWNTLKYRVRAKDSYGNYSAYTTSGDIAVIHNQPPVISGSNADLGIKRADFTYQYSVTDPDGDTVNVVEKIDGKTIATKNAITLGATQTLSVSGNTFTALTNAQHTITITATDSAGNSAVRTLTFTKSIAGFVITLSTPLEANSQPTRANIKVTRDIPAGGTFKVEATNNPFDASPVWEDCTNAVVQGVAHVFTNKINTAAQYGMNIRVTVQRGDALTACWVSGIGGNFE